MTEQSARFIGAWRIVSMDLWDFGAIDLVEGGSIQSLSRPGWRPRSIDDLYIGLTNANAFSPTDSLPLPGRAKLALQTQALISFAILTLALARVVSVFA